MKYKKTIKPKYTKNPIRSHPQYPTSDQIYPARPLQNQPDQEADANSQVAKAVGGTQTNKTDGRRRLEKYTWKDQIRDSLKSPVRKYKMKKRKKLSDKEVETLSEKSGRLPFKSAK